MVDSFSVNSVFLCYLSV